MRKIMLARYRGHRMTDEIFLRFIAVAGLDGRSVPCHVFVHARREIS